jgi:hypothetical protein
MDLALSCGGGGSLLFNSGCIAVEHCLILLFVTQLIRGRKILVFLDDVSLTDI